MLKNRNLLRTNEALAVDRGTGARILGKYDASKDYQTHWQCDGSWWGGGGVRQEELIVRHPMHCSITVYDVDASMQSCATLTTRWISF